jgi:hypothetical protein
MRIRELFSIMLLFFATSAWGGLYYSAENFNELPSQWRGFLLDQRTLRNIAQPGTAANPASPARVKYLGEAQKLEKKLSPVADDLADLGALWIRLGQPDKAIQVLREADRKHPDHFRIAANLGTAWQLKGDLAQAAQFLEQAVRLAPAQNKEAEALHLKLVRQRLRPGASTLDDLYGIRFLNDKGDYEPGKLALDQKKKLTPHTVGLAQQLALWLPADSRLLWQLAELANAHGDVRSAAAMMDGCVTTFGLNDADLRNHRLVLREAVDRLPRTQPGDKTEHKETHIGMVFRSKRPLMTRLDSAALPRVNPTGTNLLPWDLLADTVLSNKARPTFPRYLQDLAGKEVTITGFMQPLGDGVESSTFLLIENPVGCWFCEMPETSGIIYVELPAGKTMAPQRNLMRVTGRFNINVTDPEDFLYSIRGARVGGID